VKLEADHIAMGTRRALEAAKIVLPIREKDRLRGSDFPATQLRMPSSISAFEAFNKSAALDRASRLRRASEQSFIQNAAGDGQRYKGQLGLHGSLS
jgi:hypothetical protein